MRLIHSLLLTSSCILFFACQETVTLSSVEAKAELKQLNVLMTNTKLQTDTLSNKEVTFPFSSTYLEQRHHLLQQVNSDSLSISAQKELAYLVIQQRYPERYMPWPAHVDVLVAAKQKQVGSEAAKAWQMHVLATLKDAEKSNIKLNRIELARLKEYLNKVSTADFVNTSLLSYLETYKPRNQLGMRQLPNGSEWYQSKLNFYADTALPPATLLQQVQKEQNLRASHEKLPLTQFSYDLTGFTSNQSIAYQLITKLCSTVDGMNWRDNFVHLRGSLQACSNINEDHHVLILALMEVDLGIHFQSWSVKQARIALQKHIVLSDEEATKLIENVVLFPATSFVFLKEKAS